MKIIVEKRELVNIVEKMGRILPLKPPITSIGGILVEAKKEGVFFTTTYLQLTLRIFMESSIKEKGDVLLPGKNFISLIKELPEASIKMETKDNYFIIENKNFQYKLLMMSVEDFPKHPEQESVSEGSTFNLFSGEFVDMIKKTVYCINPAEPRIYFRGALLASDTKTLTMVGTDTRRLSLSKKPISSKQPIKILLPFRVLDVFPYLIKEENTKVSVSKNQVRFNTDRISLTSQLLEGEFPDYSKVIPSEKLNSAKINTQEFLSSLSRISLLSSEKFNSLKIHFRQNLVVLTIESPELGVGEEKLKVEYTGPENLIVFNPEYIGDFLKTIKEENVIFSFTEATKPAKLTPEGKEDYVYIIMPIKP